MAFDNLKAHWTLDEESGTREDSIGTHDLTDINTVTQAAGHIGNGASFDAANSEALDCADSADLSAGNVDFEMVGWVKFTSFTGAPRVICKSPGGGPIEYELTVDGSNRLIFQYQDAGASMRTVTASNFGALSTGLFYFFHAWHNSSDQLIGINVNNSASPNTQSHSGNPPVNGTGRFAMGRRSEVATNYFSGVLDAVSFGRGGLMSAEELAAVYNGGGGQTYPYTLNLRRTPLYPFFFGDKR